MKHSDRFKAKKYVETYSPKQESSLQGRVILNDDNDYTVGEDYSSFFEAVGNLSNNVEINSNVTLLLNKDGDVLATNEFPTFIGKGSFIIDGQNSTLEFIDAGNPSVLTLKNYTAINIVIKNVTLSKGNSSSSIFKIQGQNITFENVDFGDVKIEGYNCNNFNFIDCKGTQPIKMYKSGVDFLRGKLKLELYNCISELKNVEILTKFIVKGGSLLLDNPKFNYNYWIDTASIQNASIDMTGWITCSNLGGSTIIKNLISIEACSINRLPFNIDIQGGNFTFNNSYLLKLVSCTTPATFPNVSYNFSEHSFTNNGAILGLFSSIVLPVINGAVVYRDSLSVYGGNDFNPEGTSLTSTTKENAIKELYNLINNLS